MWLEIMQEKNMVDVNNAAAHSSLGSSSLCLWYNEKKYNQNSEDSMIQEHKTVATLSSHMDTTLVPFPRWTVDRHPIMITMIK